VTQPDDLSCSVLTVIAIGASGVAIHLIRQVRRELRQAQTFVDLRRARAEAGVAADSEGGEP